MTAHEAATSETGSEFAENGRERRIPPWQRAHPTPSGWVFTLMLAAIAVAALNTGNNLLYLVVGLLCGVLIVNNVLGEWNLRNLEVTRHPGTDLFAAREGGMTWFLRNRRRFGPGVSIEITELHSDPIPTRVAWVGAGCECRADGTFRPPERGWHAFTGIRLSSSFPFGIVVRSREIILQGRVLVYPAQGSPLGAGSLRRAGTSRLDDRQTGGAGDFLGLRPYRDGDPIRLIHWPTTARLGIPMTVVRGGERDDDVVIRLDDRLGGTRWEQEIRNACGHVVRGFREGRAVGLACSSIQLPPRRDSAWRLRLLATLALLPRKDGPQDPDDR